MIGSKQSGRFQGVQCCNARGGACVQ